MFVGTRYISSLLKTYNNPLKKEMTMLAKRDLLKKLYMAFNTRDIEAALAGMHPVWFGLMAWKAGMYTAIMACASIGRASGA